MLEKQKYFYFPISHSTMSSEYVLTDHQCRDKLPAYITFWQQYSLQESYICTTRPRSIMQAQLSCICNFLSLPQLTFVTDVEKKTAHQLKMCIVMDLPKCYLSQTTFGAQISFSCPSPKTPSEISSSQINIIIIGDKCIYELPDIFLPWKKVQESSSQICHSLHMVSKVKRSLLFHMSKLQKISNYLKW